MACHWQNKECNTRTLLVFPPFLSDSFCMLPSLSPTACRLSPCMREHGPWQLWAKHHSKLMTQKERVSLACLPCRQDSNWSHLGCQLILETIIVATGMKVCLAWVMQPELGHYCDQQGFQKHTIAVGKKQILLGRDFLGRPKE